MTRNLTLLLMLAAGNAAAQQIVLHGEATPRSTVVRLGDVAEVRGGDAAQIERLTRLPLMPAPAGGTRRYLRVREIEDMLQSLGEDLKPLTFGGAAQVVVQPPAVVAPTPFGAESPTTSAGLPSAGNGDFNSARAAALAKGRVTERDAPGDSQLSSLLLKSVQQAIAEQLAIRSGASEDWDIECTLSDRQTQLLSAATSLPVCHGGRAPWTGRQEFTFSFNTAEGPATVTITADVRVLRPVAVAVRAIPVGATITGADIEIQTLQQPPAASNRRLPFSDIESLLGMEATRAIQPGAVVFSDAVRLPRLVQRGDAVTVVAQGGGIRVRTTARANQEGGRGELVQVESLETKQKFDARVTGLREVAVLTPGTGTVAEGDAGALLDRGPFRRYLSASPSAANGAQRETTAFRKFLIDGERHETVR